MTYTADHPPVPSSEFLRARIPGWGVDLDPVDRPAVPKLQALDTGAHWEFPERQPENRPRERSIEHQLLTPVFGTSTPPRGVSGAIRRYSYRTYSEGRAAHWLLLLLADRVDAAEAHVQALLRLRPDVPATGIRAEFTTNGLAARTRGKRADINHMWLDPLLVAAPWLATGGAAALISRAVLRASRRTGPDRRG
ncbi:hypothetical protein [Mycolicibacterium phlei]|jgi:hypothetical protein